MPVSNSGEDAATAADNTRGGRGRNTNTNAARGCLHHSPFDWPFPRAIASITTSTTNPGANPPGEAIARAPSSIFDRPIDGPRATLFHPFEGGAPKQKMIREMLDLPAADADAAATTPAAAEERVLSSLGVERPCSRTGESGPRFAGSSCRTVQGSAVEAGASSECPSTPLPDAASIRRGPRLRHGRLTSSRTVGLDGHSVYGQARSLGRWWFGKIGLWISAGLLQVSLLALSATITGMADQIEYFGNVDPARLFAVVISGCLALLFGGVAVLIACVRGCSQARRARRDDEEAWIDLAHRNRELPPLPPYGDDQTGGGDDAAAARAWREFARDDKRLRRYVESLEERVARQRDGDVSASAGVGVGSNARGSDRAKRGDSMVTIPLSPSSGGAGCGEAGAAGTDTPRKYASMLRDGIRRAASKGMGMGMGKGKERELTAKASLSQRNLLRPTTPTIARTQSNAEVDEEHNLHSLPSQARTSFLTSASPYRGWFAEEEAGPNGAQTAAANPLIPDPLDFIDDRFTIGSSVSSVESLPEDVGKGKGNGKALQAVTEEPALGRGN